MELLIPNQEVAGSSPAGTTTFSYPYSYIWCSKLYSQFIRWYLSRGLFYGDSAITNDW